MLFICNGAYRNGSTWLFGIMRRLLVEKTPVPELYLDAAWNSPTVPVVRLQAFLDEVDLEHTHYVYKAHYGDSSAVKPLLIGNPYVRILNIYRDPKDAFVSAYFHLIHKGKFAGTLEDFFNERGKIFARRQARYHCYWDWREAPEKIFLTTYERLKNSFEQEVKRLGNFCGKQLLDTEIESLRERLRGDPRWRQKDRIDVQRDQRASVGAWKHYLSDDQAVIFDRIEQESRVSDIVNALSSMDVCLAK